MKKSDWKVLRELTIAELQTKARETKEELFNLRFQLRTGHLSDLSKSREHTPYVRANSNRDQREERIERSKGRSMEQPKRRATGGASNRDASFRATRWTRRSSWSARRGSAPDLWQGRPQVAAFQGARREERQPSIGDTCGSKNAVRYSKEKRWRLLEIVERAQVIQQETRLQVSPTTRARARCLCIHISGGSRHPYAFVGDIIVGTVK